jgi:hypothetical protein
MKNCNPYFIPNLDKNCRLEELPDGLRVVYVLSCGKDFPHSTFKSKGKNYVERHLDLKYANNMSNYIMKAYLQLKNSTMLELALWKHQQLTDKIIKLQQNLNHLCK